MTPEERKILVKMQVEIHPFADNFCSVALSFFAGPRRLHSECPAIISQYSRGSIPVLKLEYSSFIKMKLWCWSAGLIVPSPHTLPARA